jgi:hypothetical protein
MGRSWILALATVTLLGGAATASAGPCTTQIMQVEQEVRHLQAAPPASRAGEPTAPQSVGAQLHHQPTPGAVEQAEQTANADADAALARAREADAKGDGTACGSALNEAKRLYGVY